MRNPALHLAVAGALAVCAAFEAQFEAHAQWGFGQTQAPPPAQAQAQSTSPPQGTSRGENFSAKPAPQLFASDCTGAGSAALYDFERHARPEHDDCGRCRQRLADYPNL